MADKAHHRKRCPNMGELLATERCDWPIKFITGSDAHIGESYSPGDGTALDSEDLLESEDGT